MKKLYYFIFLIILSIAIFLLEATQEECKVFKIISPTEIFIDVNKNLIFDEEVPITLQNIDYIKLGKNPGEFDNLTAEEKIFLNYQANRVTQLLLSNKSVTIFENEIYIDGKKYSNLLLESGFFFDETKESKEKLLQKLKEYDLNDYVLLNTKSKRYHKLSCKEGQKSQNYKIINKSLINDKMLPCKSCINKPAVIEFKEEIQLPKLNKTSIKNGNIEVFFLDLNERFKPSTTCTTHACVALKNEIDNAQSSIDFAIYGINNQPEIFNALINAQKRGVKIRWVCDHDKKDQSYYKDTLKLKEIITTFNTDEIYDSQNRSAIMHNKFFIFDNQKVFTGSANITSTDFTGFNANISVLINSEEIAKIYKQEFDQMYNGKFHTEKEQIKKDEITLENGTKVKVYFSPKDKVLTKQIIPYIKNAKKYIYIPIFFITKKELINELTDAHTRGVDVKVINDATNASSKYSIHKELRANGIKIKTENYAGKLHTKAIIIDDEYSIIGSMNFSNNGEKRNDENMLIIKDKEIAQFLKQVFNHLWDKIPNEYLKKDPRPESLDSIGSCFDGIDNDYDGKIDAKDEGCFI